MLLGSAQQRELLLSLVLKELKAKYVGSVLGLWWSLVTPLLIMAAITFVFVVVWPVDIAHFSLFVLCAILPWMFLSAALEGATHTFQQHVPVLQQFAMNKVLLPTASVLASFCNFLVGFVCVLPLFFWFRQPPGVWCALLPVVLLLMLGFTLGLGWILSVGQIYVRDIGHLLGTVLMFWFWLSPVFYGLDMVDPQWRGWYLINPMATYLTMIRDVLYVGRVPQTSLWISGTGFSALFLVSGALLFRRVDATLLKHI